MEISLLRDLGLGLLLGLLVGVERERANAPAGIRTFAMITLLGVLTGTLSQRYGEWVLVCGFLGVLALLVTSDVLRARQESARPGITTEVAALLMFAAGAALPAGFRLLAAVTTGLVALLLHWKQPMHAVVRRLGEDEVNGIMRLVLIGLVILPVLPNRSYGPYRVLNPFEIWLMVVLIVGISLTSYVAYRLFGARAGTLFSGVIGGLISSTAATVGYARRSRDEPAHNPSIAVMILIASAVVFARVLVEIGIVVPEQLVALGLPIAIMFVLMALIASFAYLLAGKSLDHPNEAKPPSDLRAAILFGLLYAGVLLAVAAARQNLGTSGLYAVAALSGLTDMDAITLSTAQLVRAGTLESDLAWRLVITGAMANLVFKAAAVVLLGHPGLARRIASAFAIALAGGVTLMLVWP